MTGREMLRCLVCLVSGLGMCLVGALWFSTGTPRTSWSAASSSR
jgi:hypothetical protein